MERIVRLTNMVDARLVQTGDARQLNAVDRGRPFEDQRAGVATAYITENLRSRSDQMKAITTALDRGDTAGVFELLRPATTEVPGTQVAMAIAARWAALPHDERDATLLLTAGRTMRSETNRAERRLERLEDRMSRQPALEKALDARMPERQLRIDGPGIGGGSRERDQGMEL